MEMVSMVEFKGDKREFSREDIMDAVVSVMKQKRFENITKDPMISMLLMMFGAGVCERLFWDDEGGEDGKNEQ